MSPFDPLKFASDIANGIGSGIGQVASDAFRIAEQAGAAVADGIGQAFEAVTKPPQTQPIANPNHAIARQSRKSAYASSLAK